MEIRRSQDRLISTMGFPILVRCHLYIESGPRITLTVLTAHIRDDCYHFVFSAQTIPSRYWTINQRMKLNIIDFICQKSSTHVEWIFVLCLQTNSILSLYVILRLRVLWGHLLYRWPSASLQSLGNVANILRYTIDIKMSFLRYWNTHCGD